MSKTVKTSKTAKKPVKKTTTKANIEILEKEIDEVVSEILEPTETPIEITTAETPIADSEPTEPATEPAPQPEKPKRQRRGNLTFKALGIPVDTELLFKGKEEYKVTVADDENTVFYGDRRRTVSNLANELVVSILGRKEGSRVNGFEFFTYNGVKLTTLRPADIEEKEIA